MSFLDALGLECHESCLNFMSSGNCAKRLPEHSEHCSGNCDHLLHWFGVRGEIKSPFLNFKSSVNCAKRLPEHSEHCSGNPEHLLHVFGVRGKIKSTIIVFNTTVNRV